MKELSRPWNNWHSFDSVANYLAVISSESERWPVAGDSRLKNRLRGAEELETQFILPAITQFNNRRVNECLRRRDSDGNVDVDVRGFAKVVAGKRLLKHLFTTTEYNVASALQQSNLFPFPEQSTGQPDATVKIPNAFFLNANAISGGTIANYRGLGISDSQKFVDAAVIQPSEYRRVVLESKLVLGGRLGDAGFAWFVPEPSHIDNSMIDRLLVRGIATRDFVAGVLAIDLENPVLSNERAALLRFVPEEFEFRPLGPGEESPVGVHPDNLTRHVIAAIKQESPPEGSPASEFLRRLESSDPVMLLQADVTAYLSRVKERFANDSSRPGEVARLMGVATRRRRAALVDETLQALDETQGRLFPVPVATPLSDGHKSRNLIHK